MFHCSKNHPPERQKPEPPSGDQVTVEDFEKKNKLYAMMVAIGIMPALGDMPAVGRTLRIGRVCCRVTGYATQQEFHERLESLGLTRKPQFPEHTQYVRVDQISDAEAGDAAEAVGLVELDDANALKPGELPFSEHYVTGRISPDGKHMKIRGITREIALDIASVGVFPCLPLIPTGMTLEIAGLQFEVTGEATREEFIAAAKDRWAAKVPDKYKFVHLKLLTGWSA